MVIAGSLRHGSVGIPYQSKSGYTNGRFRSATSGKVDKETGTSGATLYSRAVAEALTFPDLDTFECRLYKIRPSAVAAAVSPSSSTTSSCTISDFSRSVGSTGSTDTASSLHTPPKSVGGDPVEIYDENTPPSLDDFSRHSTLEQFPERQLQGQRLPLLTLRRDSLKAQKFEDDTIYRTPPPSRVLFAPQAPVSPTVEDMEHLALEVTSFVINDDEKAKSSPTHDLTSALAPSKPMPAARSYLNANPNSGPRIPHIVVVGGETFHFHDLKHGDIQRYANAFQRVWLQRQAEEEKERKAVTAKLARVLEELKGDHVVLRKINQASELRGQDGQN